MPQEKPRRLTPNQRAWAAEIARIQKSLKRAKIDVSIEQLVGQQPKVVTKKRISELKSITPKLVRTVIEEFPTVSIASVQKAMKISSQGRVKKGTGLKPAPHPITDAERKERARRALESRRKHEARDPKFKERLDVIRTRNLLKAKTMQEVDEENEIYVRGRDTSEKKTVYETDNVLQYIFESIETTPFEGKAGGKEQLKNFLNYMIKENGRDEVAYAVQLYNYASIDASWRIIYASDQTQVDFNLELLARMFMIGPMTYSQHKEIGNLNAEEGGIRDKQYDKSLKEYSINKEDNLE